MPSLALALGAEEGDRLYVAALWRGAAWRGGSFTAYRSQFRPTFFNLFWEDKVLIFF
jgi:hypothetical protein